jgi:hypothetical protein
MTPRPASTVLQMVLVSASMRDLRALSARRDDVAEFPGEVAACSLQPYRIGERRHRHPVHIGKEIVPGGQQDEMVLEKIPMVDPFREFGRVCSDRRTDVAIEEKFEKTTGRLFADLHLNAGHMAGDFGKRSDEKIGRNAGRQSDLQRRVVLPQVFSRD